MEGNFYAREVAFQADGTPVYGPPKVLNLISMSYVGGVPPRPHPEPPLGIWGPGDPRPTNPIAGFDPIHGTWPDVPPGGGGGKEVQRAIVKWVPEDTEGVPPTPADVSVLKPMWVATESGARILAYAGPYAQPQK